MRFRTSQFFVSYTQNGIFMNSQLRKKLSLQEGDSIGLKLSIKDEFSRVTYAIAKTKDSWNPRLEESAYDKHWYSQTVISKILADRSIIRIGCIDWNNLVFDWDVESLLRIDPTVEIKKVFQDKTV